MSAGADKDFCGDGLAMLQLGMSLYLELPQSFESH